jgi:hypothetical protein
MTDREKLSELLNENFCEYCNVDIIAGSCKIRAITFEVDRFADFLISNGVTFNKWVPVALGFLPDENDVAKYIEERSYHPEFLVMIKGATEPTVLQYDGELWSDDLGMTYSVTHWMPLPEPPKEER